MTGLDIFMEIGKRANADLRIVLNEIGPVPAGTVIEDRDPSNPPLEMAHFGMRAITNSYTNKDLSRSHDNIISIDNIPPDTIADALAQACRNFEAVPMAAGAENLSVRLLWIHARLNFLINW